MTEHDGISELLRRAVDTPPAADEQVAAIGAAARRRRAVRQVTTATTLAVVVLAVVGAAFTLPGRGRMTLELAQQPPAAERPAPSGAADSGAAPAVADARWREVPDAPLDARWAAFLTSGPDGLLVWGGYAWGGDGATEGARADGAVHHDGRWSPLPDSPLSPRTRANSASGWVRDVDRNGAAGDEYWIVGGTGGRDGGTLLQDAAALRPDGAGGATWHELPAVPEPVAGGTVVAGQEMVVVAQGSGDQRAVYTLRPGVAEWQTAYALPAPSEPHNSDLHVLDGGSHVTVVGFGDVFLLTDGGVPQRVPPPDGEVLGNVRGATIVTHPDAGPALLVALPDGTWQLDLESRRWSRVAPALRPDPPQPIPMVTAGDGTVVAVDTVNGRAHALVSGGGAWQDLPALDGARIEASVAVATPALDGDADASDVVVWGGMGSEERGRAHATALRLSAAEG